MSFVGLRFEPRDPTTLHFACGSVGSPLTRFLLRQDLPFAADARIIHGDVHGRIRHYPSLPVLDLFRSSESETRNGGGGGGWARLTLRRCSAPSRASNRTCDVDAVVHADGGRLLSVRAYHVPAHGVEQLAPAQASATTGAPSEQEQGGAVRHCVHTARPGASILPTYQPLLRAVRSGGTEQLVVRYVT